MELIVNDRYKVTTDAYNWTLQRFDTVKKRGGGTDTKWIELGQFPNLKWALNRLLHEDIKEQDKVSINELINVVKQSEKNIIKASKNFKKDDI